jgi:hypothetical protein
MHMASQTIDSNSTPAPVFQNSTIAFIEATWQYHELWFWQSVTLPDGTIQYGGALMRRRTPRGEWQYRSLNDEW